MSDIYLAGKLNVGEGDIIGFSEELEKRGHSVIEKWFLELPLPKPYLNYLDTSSPAAFAMRRAAFESEVFILFPTDNIFGAAIELGAALGSTAVNPDKQVIVVNPWEVRQSVFYTDPALIAVHGLDEVRRMDWY